MAAIVSLHTDQIELLKGNKNLMILFGVIIFNLNGFQSLAVIPAAASLLKFTTVKEMWEYFSINAYLVRGFLTVDHIQSDGLNGGFKASFLFKANDSTFACSHGDNGF